MCIVTCYSAPDSESWFYGQVFCSRFHDANGQAVLLGDAAHAMSNALGQGCNSSLQVLHSFLHM